MELKEIKSKQEHYFVDEQNRKQGEYKIYCFGTGKLWCNISYKDNKLNGEYKKYCDDGKLDFVKYYKDGEDITEFAEKLKLWN